MPVANIANRKPIVAAIPVACGAGARDSGCKDGPAALRDHWDRHLCWQHPQLAWQHVPTNLCTQAGTPLDIVTRTTSWLAGTTYRLVHTRKRFLVVGGDHSCAIGTWSGASDALRRSGPLGLIWIDAHMDMHVPATTPSGAIDGMPVAALLGYGESELTGLSGASSALSPSKVCLVGARSFEPEEVAFAASRGVRVIRMDELSRRGMADVFAEARAITCDGVAGYGVSLDLDVFDVADAPGVGSPAPDGIRASNFLDVWADLTCSPLCIGAEIVEYNPHRDQSGKTAQASARPESSHALVLPFSRSAGHPTISVSI
jgi:arginase